MIRTFYILVSTVLFRCWWLRFEFSQLVIDELFLSITLFFIKYNYCYKFIPGHIVKNWAFNIVSSVLDLGCLTFEHFSFLVICMLRFREKIFVLFLKYCFFARYFLRIAKNKVCLFL